MKKSLGFVLIFIFTLSAKATPALLGMACLGATPAPLSDYEPLQIPKGPQEGLTFKDIQEVVPTDLQPTENAGAVINRIGDRIVQNWLKSDAIQSSPVGRTAASVEKAMKTEVNVPKTEPDGVDHKFSFSFLALQALTKFEYKGWLNATVNYDARASQTGIEVKEKVWHNKDLFLNHTVTSVEDTSSLGLRWNW